MTCPSHRSPSFFLNITVQRRACCHPIAAKGEGQTEDNSRQISLRLVQRRRRRGQTVLSTVLLPTLLLFLLSTPPSPASSAPASAAPRQMSIRSFFKPAGSGAALPDAGVEDGAPAAKRARLSEPPAADGTAPADAVGSPAGSRSQHETPAKGEGQGKGNSTLTQEQLERIERNRALALERKAKNASAAVAPGGGSAL